VGKVFSRAIVLVLALAAAVQAGATPVVFDFNALEHRDRSGPISDYMSAVYGSTVDADGAVAFEEADDASDLFIATSFQLLNRGDFIITFAEVPILGVQFEGRVIDGTIGDDFAFHAFAGDVEVASFSTDQGEGVFDSGWIPFDTPVDRLQFTDSGRKDIGVDDLIVQPVPEPATGLLMLAGFAALGGVRRRSLRRGA